MVRNLPLSSWVERARSFPTAGAAALCVVLTLAACDNHSADKPAPPPPPAVIVATVERSDVTPSTSFTGRVVAVDKVELRARVTGFLKERLFEEGSLVNAGDLMFVIEKDAYQAAVNRARADVAQSEASLAQATATRARVEQASRSGAVSRQQLDEAIAGEKVAAARVLETKAVLERADLDLGYTDVRTPIAGRVGRESFAIGNLVGPESGPLATVVSQDPMFVTFPVSQRLLLQYQRQVQSGEGDESARQIRLRLADGGAYDHPGVIDFTDVQVNASTDTIDVRAVFPNPDALLVDGQFVTVFVERKAPVSEIVISRSAMQIDQAGRFVLMVDNDHKVEMRRIATGQDFGASIVVTEGLKEGDRIIVEGIQRARPGEPVTPTEAETPAAETGLSPR
jgi:membrane fusion protein (multidrug efflux system)